MSVYLDASMLVSLIRIEPNSSNAVEFVTTIDRPLIVSDFAAGEVASALSRLVRTEMLDCDAATERLIWFDEWTTVATRTIATEPNDIRLAAQFVRRFPLALRMPDAIHLAASQIRGLTLATRDVRLADAAGQLDIDVTVP